MQLNVPQRGLFRKKKVCDDEQGAPSSRHDDLPLLLCDLLWDFGARSLIETRSSITDLLMEEFDLEAHWVVHSRSLHNNVGRMSWHLHAISPEPTWPCELVTNDTPFRRLGFGAV